MDLLNKFVIITTFADRIQYIDIRILHIEEST